MAKPDRFDRLAYRECMQGTYLSWPTVANLLRAQHRGFVRMVQKERKAMAALAAKTGKSTDPRDQWVSDCLKSRAAQCTDFLSYLNQRR